MDSKNCLLCSPVFMSLILCFPPTERDSGHEPVPPPQHCVLLHLIRSEGRAVAGHEAARW